MRRFVAVCVVVGIVALVGGAASRASADTVILKDGRQFNGTVISETPTQVVIEAMVANIKSKLTFARAEVEKIVRSEEKLKDDRTTTESPKPAAPQPEAPKPARKSAEDAPDADPFESVGENTASGGTPYLLIPIRGVIGEDVVAFGLERCLSAAKSRGIKHIVFEIDSPGGMLGEAKKMSEILMRSDREFTFHAVVDHKALSAATVFLANSRTIHMRPGSSTGAAVAFHRDHSTGAAEVDAKLNSAWASDLASSAERNGHSGCVFKAMVEQEARLFVWKEGEGFRFHDKEPQKELRLSATELDSKTTILTLTAADASKWGFAELAEGGADTLGKEFSCEGWRSGGNAGVNTMEQCAKARKALVKKIEDFRKSVSTNVALAKENEPEATKVTYYKDTGEFTPESLKRWKEAVDKSLRLWRQIKADFANAEKLETQAKAQGADYMLPILSKDMDYTKLVDERIEWLQKNRGMHNIK
ncbi:MAG TPA: hypothetical protein VG797_11385 [Phycisphaerales bacterium]|nr:hypothetical protein [Phycisphaerales bacterium]